MLKIGLVGVGGISGAHIPGWENMKEAELVAICDVRPEQMEKYPQYRQYTDFDEMLEKEKIDILDICLPTYLHVDFAVKAMEKGINVICEKPISLKEEDVKRAYDTAEANNVKFMIAQVLRFWPEYEFVKSCYETGKYGKLLSGVMHRLGSMPKWSFDNWMMDVNRSGLVPYDLHIHDLDFVIWAFGKPNNDTMRRARKENQDYIAGIYDYDDFFIMVESSWYTSSDFTFKSGFRFQFEDALLEYTDAKLTIYEANGETVMFNVSDDKSMGDIGLPSTNAYENEIEYFMNCVLENKPADKVNPQELSDVINILKKF